MIRDVAGDILLTSAQALAHGVAPNDNFGTGLAKGLRERWPGMYKDLRHYYQTSRPKPGQLWTWAGPGGVRIINLFTQEPAPDHASKPGKASLANVNHCLRALRKEIERQQFTSVALPKLATGVGGLRWEDVKLLVQKHLGELEIPVFVYETYRPGVQAQEEAQPSG